MKFLTFTIGLLLAIATVAAGCSDDDDASPTSADTPSPSSQATQEPIRRTESLAALRTYLFETGLDGERGDLTDPVGCESLPEEDIEGDYCVFATSTFAAALALILVADVDDIENRAWQVRVVLEDGSWAVTETVRFEPE